METICLQCGDTGFTNAFVHCVRCLKYVVHRYCLDEIPETFDEFVPWLCDDCCEIERKRVLAKRLNSTGCIRNGTKEKYVKVVADRPASKESYDDFGETKGCQVDSSKQPEEEKAEDIVLEDSSLLDNISLKKRKRAKLDDLLQKEKMHKKRKKHLLGKNLSKLSHEERAKLDGSKHANLPSDSKPQTKSKLDKGNGPMVKGCISEKPCGSDKNASKTKFPSVSCNNGSLKSSKKKKRIVTSAGAIAKEQMCRISSTQALQENKAHKIQNRNADKSTEDRNVDQSKKKYSESVEKKTFAPCNRSNSRANHPKDSTNSSPEPVASPVWKGSFDIRSKKRNFLEGLVAHLSGKACQKVSESASQLQPVLHLEKLLKSEVWPKRFKTSAPTSDSIAFYFFPTNISGSERDFDILVKEMIEKELALKASVHNDELLIFTSTELPLLYWRIQGKHYLWGVFRRK